MSVDYAARIESVDTFVFEKSAAANGTDTINNFDSGDVIDLRAFVADDAPTGGEVADGTDVFGSVANGDILLVVDADGSVNTAAEIAALFGATDVANDAKFVVSVRDTQTGGNTTLWYVFNDSSVTNSTQAIAATEVQLVGTLVGYNGAALVDANILN